MQVKVCTFLVGVMIGYTSHRDQCDCGFNCVGDSARVRCEVHFTYVCTDQVPMGGDGVCVSAMDNGGTSGRNWRTLVDL